MGNTLDELERNVSNGTPCSLKPVASLSRRQVSKWSADMAPGLCTGPEWLARSLS